eukprot:747306_1
MMCGANTIDAMFALGRISKEPMNLIDVVTTDDELPDDSNSDVIGMAYDVGGTVHCHANPPDSDRGDGDDDEIVKENGNHKINWDTAKSSSNPTARVFEHEFRHRYAFGTAIIDTEDLEGDETKGAINYTKQISECMTPITRKDVVQCNEQTIHEGCVNCDGSINMYNGYLDIDELPEDLDSDGMGRGGIIRYDDENETKVEFIGESIPDASNPIQQDEWSADTMYPF